jgi:hypothetical protein
MLITKPIRTTLPVILGCFLLFTGCKKNINSEKPGLHQENHKLEMASESIKVKNSIQGTWKLVYAEIREQDSIQVKDLTNTDFIKIINADHFAFFNQDRGTSDNFMSGAGSYAYNGTDYVETLDFISLTELRGHEFPFQLEIKGDSLIQQGHEKVEEAGLDRYILEKYVRISN